MNDGGVITNGNLENDRSAVEIRLAQNIPNLRRTIAFAAAAHQRLGAINPRPPGALNQVIQALKRLISRSLNWYTRPIREFDTAILKSLDETVQILDDLRNYRASSDAAGYALSESRGGQVIKLDFPVRPKSRYGYGKPSHDALNRLLANNREAYKTLLGQFASFRDPLLKISLNNESNSDPCWVNEFLPPLDSTSLYCLLSLRRPKTYIEIGSGNSTKFARRAVADQKLPTTIVSIDPCPRSEIDALCDLTLRKSLEDVELTFFDQLEPGDILFIDSSHRCFMNSDVTVCFLDILPRLKPGILVHFHDIFLPNDYPPEWGDRYYSEQYLLAACLLAGNSHFEIILPNAFVSQDPELRQVLYSLLWSEHRMAHLAPHGGSFWIRTK